MTERLPRGHDRDPERRTRSSPLGPDQSFGRRAPDLPDEDELYAELKFLREEVELLRRRLETSPTRIRVLEERLLETKGQLQSALNQNAKLAETLRAAREQLITLRQEVEKLAGRPQRLGELRVLIQRTLQLTLRLEQTLLEHADPRRARLEPTTEKLDLLSQELQLRMELVLVTYLWLMAAVVLVDVSSERLRRTQAPLSISAVAAVRALGHRTSFAPTLVVEHEYRSAHPNRRLRANLSFRVMTPVGSSGAAGP